ncbi:HNH endonuclease [Symmachiella macrocystis]|uniref:HNH endonuclease n=1 Tax=Symmachiella macrocystis TaxID=2527985 RepID=A0A5C6ATK4_9PLAN|nr:HNH endonuclease signature motif containing protein [Symmachiella macrocystis]TWU03060.1 HNH endonuclease [Symmachiella macrocystis]
MPAKLKTRCSHPGCPNTTRDRFCDDHNREASHRWSDERRGTPAQRGYDERWRKVRRIHIKRHPYCEDCLDDGVVNTRNLEVDHVIPIDVRPDLRLDLDNLRTRCRRHHKLKTDEDKRKYTTGATAPNADRVAAGGKMTGSLRGVP